MKVFCRITHYKSERNIGLKPEQQLYYKIKLYQVSKYNSNVYEFMHEFTLFDDAEQFINLAIGRFSKLNYFKLSRDLLFWNIEYDKKFYTYNDVLLFQKEKNLTENNSNIIQYTDYYQEK